MPGFLQRQRLCQSCTSQLLSLFVSGFAPSTQLPRHGGKLWNQRGYTRSLQTRSRGFSTTKLYQASVEHDEFSEHTSAKSPGQMEALVRQARQTFGETLPEDFLSEEEYTIYVRLYGPPVATTLPGDIDLLQGVEEEVEEHDVPENVLMRENAEGDFEEVVYEKFDLEEEDQQEPPQLFKAGADPQLVEQEQDFDRRLAAMRDSVLANREKIGKIDSSTIATDEGSIGQKETAENILDEEEAVLDDQDNPDEGVNDPEESESFESGDSTRTHPLTLAGRYGTSPSTLHISKDYFVDPITALLTDASNKQLAEVALETFGGHGLPTSTATITRPNLKQQPIALQAIQPHMGEMQGNAFMAAIMPGVYVTVMSILVEIRKRLGSQWLRDLLQKPGGPRVLDAGSGGAGVLAWREMLRAEWELMHPGTTSLDSPVPNGKSTVVTGSAALRNRASHLLDNTTFIPRLPDYDPSRDHPLLEHNNPQPRKQYDVIIAPYTLWNLKQDYMRKNQVQNLWSLLDPKGGVLILIEKGIPRGFELIAGARETLLKHHVASPGSEEVEHTIDDASQNRFGPKEEGMIIAPCTNHGKCPMYVTAETTQGRKDFCHFSQRYIRPPFLQNILGERHRNHEDISYSYVALRRGIDQREVDGIVQGQSATEAAFSGYEAKDSHDELTDEQISKSGPSPEISTLSLPRTILPPIKRKGHIILDLCTPSGKIERWTVPRAFSKQAYRDARKSKWGDLWALGAKTRVPRNIRVGMKKVKSRSKNIMDDSADDGLDGFHDSLDEIQEVPNPRHSRARLGKKSKKGKSRPKIVEEEY